MKRLGSLIASVGLLLVPALAVADSSAAEKAIAIHAFDDAQRLMASGNAASACPKFAESQRLDPQLGTLLHLAECYERLGRTASAWASFREALEVATRNNDSRAPAARARIAKLEPKLSRLALTVAPASPASLEIQQDGATVGRALWGSLVPIDPGKHEIAARAPGFKSWSVSIDVPPEGATLSVSVPALDPEPPPPPLARRGGEADAASTRQPLSRPNASRATEDFAPESRNESGGGVRTTGFVLGGVGLVSLGLGAFFAVTRQAKLSERKDANACSGQGGCDPTEVQRIERLTDEAKTNSTLATVGFAAGGAALVGGLVLVLVGAPRNPKGTGGMEFRPWAGATDAGLLVAGGW